MPWKKDDWCFCEFKLQQIVNVVMGKVTEVTDGRFRHSGQDLSDRCFPLTLKIKIASEATEYWSKKFHELNNNALNHPDLNRELIQRWADMCNDVEDVEAWRVHQKNLDDFGKSVCEKVHELADIAVEGVSLFRQ